MMIGVPPDLRIIVTGGTGVVGAAYLRRLLRGMPPGVEVCAVLRGDRARASLDHQLGPEAGRVRSLFANLTEPDQIHAALSGLAPSQHTLIVHSAADVSWDKSFEELAPLNVEGTRAMAAALARMPGKHQFIYVSSAYTAPFGWTYRNGYEETKAAADRLLRDHVPDLDVTSFSCSLVIGDSRTGEIDRFHGIFPLVKIISSGRLPFLVGDPTCVIDMVPVDWVAEELFAHTMDRLAGAATGDVVAAAGDQGVLLRDMVTAIEARVNVLRLEQGLAPMEPLTFIPYRRWKFLRRSLERWKPEALPLRDFRLFERVLSVFQPYAESDNVLPPENTASALMAMRPALDRTVDFWLERNQTATKLRVTN